ncbi:3-hydroxyisobutyrate dehydrogenase [Peniophora sp. CONT]|nr:3-hydroxyisobutyrate dehydrogenase [Peniophora sp. CONT]
MRPTIPALQQLSATQRARSLAFIGLGRMGYEMAFNAFSKTHSADPSARFVVCDALPAAAQSFATNFASHFPAAREKITVASSPAEALSQSATVITMLPSSPEVKTVYAQAGGMLPALRAMGDKERGETLFVDSTTLDVAVGRAVAAEAEAAGAAMVDAPVSGGVTGAKAATLAFMVGGSTSSYERAKPLLERMGARIVHCGPPGAGLGAKICNNLILGVQQVVVGEAMLLGERLGLEPRVLAEVINNSTGRCWASEVNNPVAGALVDKAPPCERDYEGGFATLLMLKDLGLASEAGLETSTKLPLGESAQEIYRAAVKAKPELGRKDFSSVYQHLKFVPV